MIYLSIAALNHNFMQILIFFFPYSLSLPTLVTSCCREYLRCLLCLMVAFACLFRRLLSSVFTRSAICMTSPGHEEYHHHALAWSERALAAYRIVMLDVRGSSAESDPRAVLYAAGKSSGSSVGGGGADKRGNVQSHNRSGDSDGAEVRRDRYGREMRSREATTKVLLSTSKRDEGNTIANPKSCLKIGC